MNFLSIITPTNIEEEKKKFFASDSYNPIFKYDWDVSEINDYINSHQSKVKIVKAIIGQNTDAIVKEAKELFEVEIDPDVINLAETQTAPTINSNVNLEEVKNEFEKALHFFEVDYKVQLSKRTGFTFRPNHIKKLLIIAKDASLEFSSIDSAIKHELTHILRAINSKFNSIKKDKNFLPTEEGLASFIGDYHSTNGEGSYYQHCIEYLATAIALQHSLRKVFEFMKSKGFSDELAWQKAIRHKFGFVNTELPGDIMKPAMYFYHENKIKNLDSEQILRLFMGKISLPSLLNYKGYTGQISKEKLIEFFKL